MTLQDFKKVLFLDRFTDEGSDAATPAFFFFFERGAGSHGHKTKCGLAKQLSLLHQLVTIHDRHAEISEHDIIGFRLNQIQSFMGILGQIRFITQIPQKIRGDFAVDEVVIHDQDALGIRLTRAETLRGIPGRLRSRGQFRNRKDEGEG